MLLPHLFELLALVFLVTTVTAFPAQSSAFVGHTASLCHSEYARCLRQVHSTSLCRILVCSTYGSQVIISIEARSESKADKDSVSPM